MQNILVYDEDDEMIQKLVCYYDTSEADIIATLLQHVPHECFPEFFAE